MSHFPTTSRSDRTSPHVKASVRETSAAEVWEEIEAERQALDRRTERLRAMRLAKRA